MLPLTLGSTKSGTRAIVREERIGSRTAARGARTMPMGVMIERPPRLFGRPSRRARTRQGRTNDLTQYTIVVDRGTADRDRSPTRT